MRLRTFQAGLALLAALGGADTRAVPPPDAPDGMVLIPAGPYVPLFKTKGTDDVAAFWLDARPVTNGEFLEFLRSHPAWRRSEVTRLFADPSYLSYWAGDLDLGPLAPSNAPVTSISWFAARAYAKAQGKRLPTVAEWERAAAASETEADAQDDDEFLKRILNWYGRPVRLPLPPVKSTFENLFGAWDLHGLVWEWVMDFNTALVTGESRADAGLERNLFCGSGSVGAASFRDYAAFMRYAFRSSLKASYTVQNLGFRCARDLQSPISEGPARSGPNTGHEGRSGL